MRWINSVSYREQRGVVQLDKTATPMRRAERRRPRTVGSSRYSVANPGSTPGVVPLTVRRGRSGLVVYLIGFEIVWPHGISRGIVPSCRGASHKSPKRNLCADELHLRPLNGGNSWCSFPYICRRRVSSISASSPEGMCFQWNVTCTPESTMSRVLRFISAAWGPFG